MKREKVVKQLIKRVKREKINFIYLQFTDLFGKIKSTTIPSQRFPEAIEKGIGFDGSSIEGWLRVCESDALLKADPQTFLILPWSEPGIKTARVLCNILNPDHTPFERNPRYILQKRVDNLKKQKMIYNVASEMEFFLFQKREDLEPIPHDRGGYFDFSPRDLATQIKEEILLNLEKLKIPAEMSHHENAKGQHEIDIRYTNALDFADRVITTKYVIQAVAQKHNVIVSFMPKPLQDEWGSGMHIHQSLFNLDNKNLFYDSSDEKYKLSQLAYWFLAGQLKFAQEISAIISPTVNSYKRLVPGFEAPTRICWGQINRSALIRIPSFSLGRKTSTRLEFRSPDPSCNPYLAYAVLLEAGLEGIKQKLPYRPAVEEDVYKYSDEKLKELNIPLLPASLGEAINYLEKSKLVKKVLGEQTWLKFIEIKKREWNEYIKQVTRWELKKYL